MKIDLSLPMPANRLIPQRSPFCLVSRLLDIKGQSGVVESIIASDNILLNDNGGLNQLATVELIAQASAAVKGYNDLLYGKGVKRGFLVDIRKVRFLGQCFEGDRLKINVEILKNIGGFSVIKGEVTRKGDIIAFGTIKLWVPEDSET